MWVSVWADVDAAFVKVWPDGHSANKNKWISQLKCLAWAWPRVRVYSVVRMKEDEDVDVL